MDVEKSSPPDLAPPGERLLARDLLYSQSSNVLRIRNVQKGKHGADVRRIRWSENWFHRLLRFRTLVTLTTLIAVWTVGLLIFAGIYMAVDAANPKNDCGLHPYPSVGNVIPFGVAFAFSLETATTVGYGLPGNSNAYFEGECSGIRVAIYFQMVMSMMFQAFLFSFFYARLSRSEARGAQVLFSDKATLRRRDGDGRWVLEFRLYDADSKYPLVEAHVRLYAIRHPRRGRGGGGQGQEDPKEMSVEPMRVWKPNDELGGMLLASVPTVVSHHIDVHSPLSPRRRGAYYEDVGRTSTRTRSVTRCEHVDGVCPDFSLSSCGMNLRELDSATGSRDGLQCRVCGETYSTRNNLARHIKFQQLVEAHDSYPVEGSHQELDIDTVLQNLTKGGDRLVSQEEIRSFIAGESEPYHSIEILVVVEAIEPLLSGTFQSMQSYTFEDIAFGGEFVPCLLADGEKGSGCAAAVDFDRFHRVAYPPHPDEE